MDTTNMANDAPERVQGDRWGAAPSTCGADAADTWGKERWIGPWGTAGRAIAGAAAITLGVAMPHQHPLLGLPGASSDLVGLLVGFVGAPAVLTVAIWARGRSAPRLHLGHGAACLITMLAVVVAQFYPVAVLVGIGAPLVLLVVCLVID